MPVHRRRLAYVFQGLALFPHMTAARNVAYAMANVPRDARRAKVQALLDRVGVGHLADRRPSTFSGGEAQRVALARVLARSPKLILLDEPFSALDRELRAQLTALVRELVAELGVPLIHVTHSVTEARALADQIIQLDHGRVIARGTPAEVLASVGQTPCRLAIDVRRTPDRDRWCSPGSEVAASSRRAPAAPRTMPDRCSAAKQRATVLGSRCRAGAGEGPACRGCRRPRAGRGAARRAAPAASGRRRRSRARRIQPGARARSPRGRRTSASRRTVSHGHVLGHRGRAGSRARRSGNGGRRPGGTAHAGWSRTCRRTPSSAIVVRRPATGPDGNSTLSSGQRVERGRAGHELPDSDRTPTCDRGSRSRCWSTPRAAHPAPRALWSSAGSVSGARQVSSAMRSW